MAATATIFEQIDRSTMLFTDTISEGLFRGSHVRIVVTVVFLIGAVTELTVLKRSGGIRFVRSSSHGLGRQFAKEHDPTSNVSFAFYAMGDTPYGIRDEKQLSRQIEQMQGNIHKKAAFLVHLGDLQKAEHTECSKRAFEKARDILSQFPLTTLVIAGDNDYHECPHPHEAWNHFSKYFLYSESRWPNAKPLPFLVERSTRNPELFVFLHDGILFLSVNLMDKAPHRDDLRLEWEVHNQDNLIWIDRNVRKVLSAKHHVLRGVIIFGHSIRSPSTRAFFEGLYSIFEESRDTPVLYLHGDGHYWKIDKNFAKQKTWEAFRGVQVDRGGEADPLLIEIASTARNGESLKLAKEKPLQYVLFNGLIRIDRQKGLYPAQNHS